MVIISHMHTLTTIVCFNLVAERNLVDERSMAKWVERMVRELRENRSMSRLRVLPRRAVRLRVAPR